MQTVSVLSTKIEVNMPLPTQHQYDFSEEKVPVKVQQLQRSFARNL